MKKKKILVLAPVMACHEHADDLLRMLSFLNPTSELTVLDPLLELSSLSNDDYYKKWQETLSSLLNQYDAYIGFSFGAVILQQCFPLFESQQILDKPVILFSAPAFTDAFLSDRLGKVIEFAQKNQLEAAYQLLMSQVLHPFAPNKVEAIFNDVPTACARLSEGLTRVITTDSRAVLSTTSVKHYHFIGEQSYLVNRNHVFDSKNANLVIVPNAGMRVLQDNVEFCYQKIEEILS